MILKILSTLNKGTTKSFDDIAEELGIETDFVRHLVNELERMGYLEKNETSSRTCVKGSCKCKTDACCSAQAIKTWKLTQKGQIAI